MTGKLWLGDYSRSKQAIQFSYGLDDHRFNLAYRYKDIDLIALEGLYGAEFLERIYFHIVVFEAAKLLSFKPTSFDLGPFSRCHTQAFEGLWGTLCHGIWSQWRYENNLPDYGGPIFLQSRYSKNSAVRLKEATGNSLLFCGGGKDSLVSAKLLEESNIPFETYGYASSAYGEALFQHQIIERLVCHTASLRHHQSTVDDDFWESGVEGLCSRYGVKSFLSAETPASLFAVLPLVLDRGYQQIILAHERSADFGNMIWEKTGEVINHQWGKSYAAEKILNQYLGRELLLNVHYFSVLKPMYDPLIFATLYHYPDAVLATHSCNIRKPWCGRCAKCAYLWLNYSAYLPHEIIAQIFKEKLIDAPENELFFRQLLGLEDHTPFECVGTVEESRLALELCRRKGIEGRKIDSLYRASPEVNLEVLLTRFFAVDPNHSLMPESVRHLVVPKIEAMANRAQATLHRLNLL